MDEWRLRILKLIQYSCSLSAVGLLSSAALASAGPSLSSVTLSKQLDKVASLISLSRRSMRLGDWIEGISDLKDALGGGGAGTASSKLKCLCAAASVLSDLAEDVRNHSNTILSTLPRSGQA